MKATALQVSAKVHFEVDEKELRILQHIFSFDHDNLGSVLGHGPVSQSITKEDIQAFTRAMRSITKSCEEQIENAKIFTGMRSFHS